LTVPRETTSRLRAFALIGARARLEEIRQEEASLRAEFPELFRGSAAAPAAPAKRRGRRSMSPAQKKAVSERMRKYWADRRKKAEKKPADKK
jgi:hypothetical protein